MIPSKTAGVLFAGWPVSKVLRFMTEPAFVHYVPPRLSPGVKHYGRSAQMPPPSPSWQIHFDAAGLAASDVLWLIARPRQNLAADPTPFSPSSDRHRLLMRR